MFCNYVIHKFFSCHSLCKTSIFVLFLAESNGGFALFLAIPLCFLNHTVIYILILFPGVVNYVSVSMYQLSTGVGVCVICRPPMPVCSNCGLCATLPPANVSPWVLGVIRVPSLMRLIELQHIRLFVVVPQLSSVLYWGAHACAVPIQDCPGCTASHAGCSPLVSACNQ